MSNINYSEVYEDAKRHRRHISILLDLSLLPFALLFIFAPFPAGILGIAGVWAGRFFLRRAVHRSNQIEIDDITRRHAASALGVDSFAEALRHAYSPSLPAISSRPEALHKLSASEDFAFAYLSRLRADNLRAIQEKSNIYLQDDNGQLIQPSLTQITDVLDDLDRDDLLALKRLAEDVVRENEEAMDAEMRLREEIAIREKPTDTSVGYTYK